MRAFLCLTILLVSIAGALCANDSKNEQRGKFHLFKVKPKSSEDLAVLLRSDEQYGDHPPIFLQYPKIHENANILIEETKVHVLERILYTHKIKFITKGVTLVEAITVRFAKQSEADQQNEGPRPDCDCDHKNGGCVITKAPPAGWACKCSFRPPMFGCTGRVFKCDPSMQCPANCTSKECCQTGKGNCNGYP